MKLSKAEAVSIIITLIFVAAVIVISLWTGGSDAAVSVSFQNINSAETAAVTSPAPAENSISPSPASAVNSVLPSPAPSESKTTAAVSPQALININTATAQELCSLPGIGEVLAKRIIEYRQAHGSFKNTGAIMNVSGIGAVKYKNIKDLIVVN